jgi:long-subunit acyl-CoA synthetase (AMP-forming)
VYVESRQVHYFGDESATRGAFTDDGFFRTGDLG